jgi:hypothetical protein
VNPFQRYFRRERDYEAEVESEANSIVEFANTPYFQVFMEWLETESDKPLPLGDHLSMVSGVARSNTLKEVKRHLKNRVAAAQASIADTRGDMNV